MRRVLFLFLVIVFFSQCGFGSRQKEADRVTRALALTVRTFLNFFQDNLSNCDAFFQIYDEISTEPQECDNGSEGSFQLSKGMVTCEDGPPLTAEADFILVQNNCRDNGTDITSTGSMGMIINFSAAGNIGMLSTSDLEAQGLMFVFDGFETKLDFSNNNLSCNDSGDLTVDGSNCSVSSDCRRCNF